MLTPAFCLTEKYFPAHFLLVYFHSLDSLFPMLFVIDKPHDRTSFDIVKKVRSVIGERKVWHAGTLDPFATGLMLIASGADTKKLHGLTGSDKTYITTIDFSLQSDTRDLEYRQEFSTHSVIEKDWVQGLIISWEFLPAPTLESLAQKLESILGTAMLPLTPFNARKRKGKKMYTYARSWNPIFIDTPMTTEKFEIVSYDFPKVTVKLEVWIGTYIRSIGHRLGREFGLWWVLTELRRTHVWDYSLDDAITMDEFLLQYDQSIVL
jgi:tRNA pseudouridine55 synthase